MKKKRNGFTLVELLVTIILLGLVGAIVIYNMTSVAKTSQKTKYERYVAAVKSAASVYADSNPEAFDDLYETRSFVYIKVEDLVKAGLLDEELINPYTNEPIGLNEIIKANLDSVNGALTFEYPMERHENETFLVALSDYVVWGEGYNCMQGAGTYQLALSEEDGTLVMMDNAEKVKQYEFKCKMPVNFDPRKSGNYEIEYTWLTSSKTRKSATRTLKVLAKAKPSFTTNYDYLIGDVAGKVDAEWYTPTYNKDTGKWTYLTYMPYIEGVDSDNLTFKITKQSNNPIGKIENVTPGYVSEVPANLIDADGKGILVDDGDKTYRIETKVYGHYNKNYSYIASGDYVMRQRLIIPQSFITNDSTIWASHRVFSISAPYSPVGVKKYEYRLSNSTTKPKASLPVEELTSFNYQSGVTSKDIKLFEEATQDECLANKKEYKYIYFRAINEDGYVGEWTALKNIYLTNSLDLLIKTDSNGCTDCNVCCQGATSCMYCDKTRYMQILDKKYIILERYADGIILATTDGVVSSNRVTPTSLIDAKWSIETCDGTFSKKYKYSSPLVENIFAEAETLIDKIPNFRDIVDYYDWPVNKARFSSFVGTVSRDDYKRYGKALYETNPYWTTDTYRTSFDIYVDTPYAHGNSTTKHHTYFYAIEKGVESKKYAGSDAYVKPMIRFKQLYICGGDGTSSSPYTIATEEVSNEKYKGVSKKKQLIITVMVTIVIIAVIITALFVLKKENIIKPIEPINEKFSFLVEQESFLIKNDDMIEGQSAIEKKYLQEFRSKKYTIDNPYVIKNPFYLSPQTALVMFKTEESEKVTVTIKGKHQDDLVRTFEASKEHILPIYGLYGNYDNIVVLETESGKKNTINIKINEYSEPIDIDINENKISNSNGEFYFATSALGAASIAYDNYGEVRWWLNIGYSKGMTFLKNGHLLLSTANEGQDVTSTSGVVEVDMLGYTYHEYEIGGGYHHDGYEMENGDLIILTSKPGSNYIADHIVELDRESGKVKKEWNMRDIVSDIDPSLIDKNEITWGWINSVTYDKKSDSLILSLRNQNSVVSLGYTSGKINWILGEKKYWSNKFAKYLIKGIGTDFIYPKGQHSVNITKDGYLSIFNNGYDAYKEERVSCKSLSKNAYAMLYNLNLADMTTSVVWKFGQQYFSYALSSFTYASGNHKIFNSGWHFTDKVDIESSACNQFSNDSYDTYIIEFDENNNIILNMHLDESKFEVVKADIYNLSASSVKPTTVTEHKNYTTKKGLYTTTLPDEKYETLTEKEALKYAVNEDCFISFYMYNRRFKLNGILPDSSSLKVTFISPRGIAYRFNMKNANKDLKDFIDLTKLPSGRYYVYVDLDNKVYNTLQHIEI